VEEHKSKGTNVWGKPAASSAGRFMGWNTIWGKDGDHDTPYMTRIWIGRLRLHIFHRGDQDPDCHDHPWDFWTFPFTSYVEEVATYSSIKALADMQAMREDGLTGDQINEAIAGGRKVGYALTKQIVPAWRLTFRPATHTHRVLGPYTGERPESHFGLYDEGRLLTPRELYREGRIVTLVWRGDFTRKWGFLKLRDGRWCWTPWKEYVFGNGKSAPCE
jgi:hypothetical protein